MITPSKLYMLRNDVPMESLLDLKEMDGRVTQAGTYSKGRNKIDLSSRSTSIKSIDPNLFFDINFHLLKMIEHWDSSLDPNDYVVDEYNYLIYKEGDHFKKHRDVLPVKRPRIFSTSTIISYTDDFEGGEFEIWSEDGFNKSFKLKPGETIFFDSKTHHQVHPVKKGIREVLVAWIYKK